MTTTYVTNKYPDIQPVDRMAWCDCTGQEPEEFDHSTGSEKVREVEEYIYQTILAEQWDEERDSYIDDDELAYMVREWADAVSEEEAGAEEYPGCVNDEVECEIKRYVNDAVDAFAEAHNESRLYAYQDFGYEVDVMGADSDACNAREVIYSGIKKSLINKITDSVEREIREVWYDHHEQWIQSWEEDEAWKRLNR